MDKVGGLAYLSELPDASPGVFNFGEYLATLRDKAHRRWLMAKAVEMTTLAAAPTVTIEDTQARLSELFDATQRATGAGPMMQIVTPKP